MKYGFATIVFLFFSWSVFAQNVVSGKVVDPKNNPIPTANVYIEGSYDGATTNDKGEFTFTTNLKGTQLLIISALTFETLKIPIVVEESNGKNFKLKESINALDAVIVTAGTFDTGEKARVSVLKPLDIVTTAGSNANIVAALQTLPGTQNVGEDGRLFVRGGEADETQTFVDGIRVAQPYGATTNNLPTRGRFSPFLFSGMAFSTGGYSAEYGEALSSVLLLNTRDEEEQKKTDVSLMTVGLGLAHTQKWKKQSVSFNTAYINLEPYQKLIPQNSDWNKPYQSLSGETVYKNNLANGIFKMYAAFDASQFDINQENIDNPNKLRVNLKNNNFYLNASLKLNLKNQWQLFTGLSYGYNGTTTGLNLDDVTNKENASQLKLKFKKTFSDKVKLIFGADYFSTKFDENFYDSQSGIDYKSGYDANIIASYAEADIFFSKKFAAKAGVRFSNNNLLKETVWSPRISLAFKVTKNGQFSFAYGDFYQAPKQDYLKYTKWVENEKAQHYIFNYQYNKNKQTFRTEWYVKNYSNLVKYNTETPMHNSVYTNNGSGYAQGLDVFWRDGKTFKYLEYWVSYSYIDSQRDYKNFPTEVTPNFIAKHSLTVVGKYWIDQLKSQLSVTHAFTTGRPYNNPNELTFMNGKTKAYSNLSLSWAYLLSQQKILYFSVNNVLGTQNVFGYEYANSPDANGIYNRKAIVPSADQFFFVGFFWTISADKNENQLKNL